MAVVIEWYTENVNRGKCNQFKVINEKSALQRKQKKENQSSRIRILISKT